MEYIFQSHNASIIGIELFKDRLAPLEVKGALGYIFTFPLNSNITHETLGDSRSLRLFEAFEAFGYAMLGDDGYCFCHDPGSLISDTPPSIRIKRNASYFLAVSNRLLKNNRLSFEARGMVMTAMAYPDNSNFNDAFFLSRTGSDLATIQSCIEELGDAGYLRELDIVNDNTFETIGRRTFIVESPDIWDYLPVTDGSLHINRGTCADVQTFFPIVTKKPVHTVRLQTVRKAAEPAFA